MIAEDRNVTAFEKETDSPLSPPRFDESATANAQQVKPIPKGRFKTWLESAGSVRKMITNRSRALALIVIGGLATGALGGLMLLKEPQQSTGVSPAVSESVSESPGPEAQTAEPRAAVVGGTGLESTSPATTGFSKSRPRARRSATPRAYRVDVIR